MADEMLTKLRRLQATEDAIQKKVDDFAKELGYDLLFDDDPDGLRVIKDSWKLQLRLGCEKIVSNVAGYNQETGKLDLYSALLENMNHG